MQVAVIGAGIVGITSAHELSCDGHQVTVFERRGSVAVEASFANAGVLAPGYVTPWAAPGMLRKVLGQWGQRDAAVRMASLPGPALAAWLWQWWRACALPTHLSNRAAMLALATASLARTRELATELSIAHERTQGLLVLLRSEQELVQARPGLKLLTDLGVGFHVVDASVCRLIEPALSEATAIRAGIHLPGADVGNCRQFALGLKAELQRRGVEFRFGHAVQSLTPGARVGVDSLALATDVESTFIGSGSKGQRHTEQFDAVVVCAALDSRELLRPLGLKLPLQPVHGYSITLPVRHFEAHPDVGPRAALMDERFKVAITRLGDRVRVAGGAELGGAADRLAPAPIATLHRVLQDWFPSAARHAKAQTWKGARPMLPDGPPVIGAAGVPGVWVNTGHGSSGWALACGSAKLLADTMAGRAPALDASRFSPLRWR
ncbi:MAG: FAD-dependent oxidoreductase [Pseudomonadota bacterium]